MLTLLRGKDPDFRLLHRSFRDPPSLVIDCANCADVHRLFSYIREEQLEDVHVMNAEAIYRLRDTLQAVPMWAERLNVKGIFVTTIGTLFSYDNEEENMEVISHCYELIRELAKKYNVFLAIDNSKYSFGKFVKR